MERLNREILLAELTRDEGSKLKAYKDTMGFWTIGTGRNLDAMRRGARGISLAETLQLRITRATCLSKGITNAQRMVLLDNDVSDCLKDLDQHLPWWRNLDGVRQRVLVNMCFNMGTGTLLTFKNTLSHIQAGRYNDAAIGMLNSKWASQVHGRADRLATLMVQGESRG